ncbi:ParB/RepB/Spo0J family partition protein [Streptomyces sp. NPDC090085]|uniref:ParB/RepB/Spo0J family partition protein n=1 Tax=Streptomyces sp. NPDC090085 TaxID=3365943 RepID=UPI00380F1310
MSKKDLLGSSASFSSARRPSERSERGRAKALAQGDIPAYELVKLQLDEVSPTPLNPRRNFGTEAERTRFGEELRVAQVTACVAVTRSAYLALWPAHEATVGKAHHILVNGERRYRSARHVGLESLDFVVRDDLAKTREDFVHYLLAENLDREDFDVIERARGVAQLVAICAEEKEFGSKSRAAERLGKSPSWITHQLVLLELPDDIQAMLSSGDMPERDGRALARALRDDPTLGPQALLALLKSSKERETRAKEEQQAILRAAAQPESEPLPRTQPSVVLPAPSPGLDQLAPATAEPLTAVKGSPPPAPVSAPNSPVSNPAPEPEPDTTRSSAPIPAPALETQLPHTEPSHTAPQTASSLPAEDEPTPEDSDDNGFLVDLRRMPRMPWHDGSAVADLVFEKMEKSQRSVLLERLLEDHSNS